MIMLIKKKGYNLKSKEEIYFPQWTRQAVVTETQMAKRMARGSTFSVGERGGSARRLPAVHLRRVAERQRGLDRGAGHVPAESER